MQRYSATRVQGATPLNAQLLINYDLPTNKERHSRRMAAVLGGDGGAARTAAIHFVVAGAPPCILNSSAPTTPSPQIHMMIDQTPRRSNVMF